jgi:hypothetical protein
MHFSDQTGQWDYSVGSMPDATFTQADTNDAQLENFFSRPVKIANFTWSPGVTLFETFNPWTLYWENSRVINRIANFNLLRAKLKVRIVLNGNGFYYGRAIASYTPLHTLDEMTQDRAYFIQDVVAASQRPHIYIDPTNSQGGDLTLPFFWYRNNLSIPDAQWREMGDMHIHQLQPLKHANGATTPVTVTVFAWAEDVSMSIPTQNDPAGLVPQAGEDEYGQGIVSRPAAVVSKAAGLLKDIPVIGMYARATELAASAVANVAKVFGYSRPVMTETSIPFSPHLIGNLPNTSVTDQSTKLTFDLKQELSIDPRTMGLGSSDEMAIKSIATRESFLTSFSWDISSAVGALLWNTEVTPVTWSELNEEIHLPACAFAALPFRYWKGTMKYRFQVVASAFHKGRLQISFDPRLTGIGEFNTQYVYLIDLAKERDFTVEIGWGHESGALLHRRPGSQTVPYSIFPFPIPTLENRNGIVSVRIVNELTSPNSTVNNDVEVNVFVSAGDDFEVFVPDAALLDNYMLYSNDPPAQALQARQSAEGNQSSYGLTLQELEEEVEKEGRQNEKISSAMLEAQSGEEPIQQPDSDLTKSESEPMKLESSIQMAPTPEHSDCFTHVYFGDPVTSFRQCLKRYALHSTLCKTNTSNTFTRARMCDFPYYRGFDPNGVDATSLGDEYNYCTNTLLNYVTSAYTARRGGIRWKYVRTGSDPGIYNTMMTLTRESESPGGYQVQNNNVTAVNAGSVSVRTAQFYEFLPSGWDGMAATTELQNPVLEVEIPYMIARRFSPAKRLNVTQNSDVFDTFHRLQMLWTSSGGDSSAVHRLVSVGEDFTLNFYTGPPVMYFLLKGSEPNPAT